MGWSGLSVASPICRGPLELLAGARQVSQRQQDPAEGVAARADLDVVRAQGGFGEGDPAFGQRSSLPVLAAFPQIGRGAIEQPASGLLGDLESCGVLGDGEQMRQQPRTVGPTADIAALVRKRLPQQRDRGLGPLSFTRLAQPGLDYRLDQSVQPDGVGGDRGQGVAADGGQGAVVGQPVADHRGQRGGQHPGLFGGQPAWNLRRQERTQAQQRFRGGGLGMDPVQRHRPHTRHPPLIPQLATIMA